MESLRELNFKKIQNTLDLKLSEFWNLIKIKLPSKIFFERVITFTRRRISSILKNDILPLIIYLAQKTDISYTLVTILL